MLDSRLWDEYGSLSPEGHRGEYQDIFSDYTYENGKLHFKAWVKDGKTKEKGLTGWYLWQLKAPYANLVSSLEKELIDKLPQDSELRLQAEDSVQLENSSRFWNCLDFKL